MPKRYVGHKQLAAAAASRQRASTMNPHAREREKTKHTQVLDSTRVAHALESQEPRVTKTRTIDVAPGFTASQQQSIPSANALSAQIPSKLAQYLFLQMQALKSARAVGELTHAPINQDTHKTQRLVELDKIMKKKPTDLCNDRDYAIALAAPILQKGVRRSGLMQTIRECPEKNITEQYFGFKSNVLCRWKREHPTDRLSVTIKYLNGRDALRTVKIQTITEPECFYFDDGSSYDSVLHYHPLNWSVQELQLRGSCSTRQTYTRTDLADGWTVMNIKSSANQCLTACFRSFMLEQLDDPKYKQATKQCNTIEKLARCPHACQKDTPRDESDIRALCLFFEIYARVFIHGRKKAIITIGDIHHKVLDLLREGVDGADMHYLRITQGTPIHTTQTIDFIAREHKEKKANAELNDTERARLYAEQMESRTWTDTKQSFDELVTRIVSTKSNVLIEGGAGVGKSTLARRVCNLLRSNHVTVHMCATTGIAACAYVGGMTIDRFMMIHKTSTDTLNDNVLFIDEISMMSGYHFDKVATFCQSHKMRMIAIGDVCQLPPVAQKEEGYFMQAERFVTMNFQKVRLDIVRRTDNQEFAHMCKSFRTTDTHDAHYSPIPLDWFDAHYVADANPDEYDIYLSSRNVTVDEYNARTLDTFEEHYEYEVREHSSDEVREHSSDDKEPFRCAVGARVMVTRNHMIDNRLIANGMTGTVVECFDDYINVLIDGDEEVTPIAYISSNYIYDRQDKHNSHEQPYKFIPLKLAFAMTIHKSQGSTIRGRVLVNWDNLFGSSMLYVALTRVTDPDNITFTGSERRPNIKSLYPNKVVSRYMHGYHVDTIVEAMAKSDCTLSDYVTTYSRKPISVTKKSDADPYTVLYFDFETAINPSNGNLRPYLCSYLQEWHNSDRANERGYMCDIPNDIHDESSVTDPVTGMIARILDMIAEYEEHIKEMLGHSKGSSRKSDFTKQARDMRKSLNDRCPVLASFNGANFDLYFIMQKLLNGSYIDMHKYAIVPVFKGCSLVTFNIISKTTFVRVLRAHDIAQIVTCSLSSACKMFLDPSDPEASKIDYHYEIMDISAKRYKEWRNWTLEDMKRPITIQVFENDPDYAIVDESMELSAACARYTHAREITYVPYDVIAYCMRDTDVLPKLYSAINQMNRADCGLPIWSFLTIGALTFYCGMVHAKPMIVKKTEEHITEQRTEWKGHKTELYPLDIEQEHFTRPAIFGGRACPRVLSDTKPCVYADVSGMYTSILVRSHLPYGDITWIAARDACARVERLKDFALTIAKYAVDHGIHPIQCMQLRAPDYFICECEFTEYSGMLEPVLPARDAMHRTIFTVERRQATITSVDMLTILLMGGTIHNVGRMLHFAKGAPYAREWATICQDGKVKYKRSNRGLSQLYKLKGNGFYGQLMRKDHTDQFTIVSREDQTMDFLRDHDWRYFLELDGDQDILYGSARDDVASFMTTRPTYAGAFVLAYSRVMIMQIINLVNPMNQLDLQPRLGDTDSLLIPLSRIKALQSFRIDNDIMIEQLSSIWNAVTARIHNESFVYVGEGVVPEGEYECTGWFPMPYIDTDGKIIKLRARTGQLTDECMDTITDHGLHDRTKQKEYDDNTKFAIVERVFSPAPKMLACVFRDPVSGRLCSKYRCKGISSSAQVGDSMYSSTLISAGELFAYEDAGEHTTIRATMPDKLKKVGPGCVRASDRADAGAHLLTIHSYDLVRKILSKDWEGRKRVRCQYTAPYGWIDPNQ